MESQTTFINRDIGPGLLEQIILADGLSGTVHENNKDIQRAAAQMDRNSRLLKKSLRRPQHERPEPERIFSVDILRASHLSSQFAVSEISDCSAALSDFLRSFCNRIRKPCCGRWRLNANKSLKILVAMCSASPPLPLVICHS